MIKETYMEIVKTIPSVSEKPFWKKYIYLNLSFSSFYELDAMKIDSAFEIIENLIETLRQHKITSKKSIIFGFRQLIRKGDVKKARQWLGKSIGLEPDTKIFKTYIDFESQLGNFDRCEKIYQKWLQTFPLVADPWENYLEFNFTLGKLERMQKVFELAISGKLELAQPERIYKKFIDIMTELGDYERVRNTFRDLLQKTGHIKVFLASAHFEFSIGDLNKMREIFNAADQELSGKDHLKEERAILLRNWLDIEGSVENNEIWIKKVKLKLPKKVRKQRQLEIETEEGVETMLEEYYDFVFPDEVNAAKGMKLLEKAKSWKKNLSMIENKDQ